MGKLIGALMIIGSSSTWGFWAAFRLAERCRLLKVWIRITEMMKIEIYFQARLLPEVFSHVARWAEDQDIGAVFSDLAKSVEYGAAFSMETVWKQGLARPVWRLLQSGEREILEEYASFLGCTDRNDQSARLDACKARLERQLQAAENEYAKQSRFYRYFGFAVGTMIALWLL